MYNSNHKRYNQLVNFGFVGTGFDTAASLLSNNKPVLKIAAVTGGLGSAALGYKAIKDDQARNQEVFNRALDADTPDERKFLQEQYKNNNNAFMSDTRRNGGFALGGLLGAGAVVVPTIGYNLAKGNKWYKFLV